MDSNDGGPEGASRCGRFGPGGGLGASSGLGIFPCGNRHWGHVLGTCRGGSGNG